MQQFNLNSDSEKQNKNLQSFQREKTFSFKAPWLVYTIAFSQFEHSFLKVAIGSFIENKTNEILIVNSKQDKTLEYQAKLSHQLPPSQLSWVKQSSSKELLISAGQYLTIWDYIEGDQMVFRKQTLYPSLNQKFTGPSIQFDYHKDQPNILVSCSLDTTLSIWDLERSSQLNQIKAHEREVNDVSFGLNPNNFVTVSSDGTCRQFDTRDIHKCTLIHEQKNLEPLFKVSCDTLDGLYISLLQVDGNVIYIYDVRMPFEPLNKLRGHTDFITQIQWNPRRRQELCSTSDDGLALIWRMQDQNQKDKLQYSQSFHAGLEIYDFAWSAQPDILGITSNQYLQILNTTLNQTNKD